ncbi:MAG TPA: hypothetical protein VGL29_04985 [Blastocatellia bacterium]
MSTLLEIEPETAEILASQARALGLSIDEYLRTLIARTNERAEEKPFYQSATPQELAQAYVEWVASHRPSSHVVLDDRREVIYGDDER